MAGGSIYVYRKPPRRRPRRNTVKPGVPVHAIFYDVGIAADRSGAEWRDLRVSVETLPAPAIAYNVGIAAERIGSSNVVAGLDPFSGDFSPDFGGAAQFIGGYSVASEWIVGTRISYDATIPSETLSLSRLHATTPLEWGGSATAVFYDLGIPSEGLGAFRSDRSVPVELGSAAKTVFYDVGLQIQLLAVSQQDATTPAEWVSVPALPITPVFAPSGFGRLPTYTDADFQLGMQNLLPTGPVWPRDADAQQTQIIGALTKTYTRNAARATNLLSDAFPTEPVELLPEWELSLGLPDPCAGELATVQQRQQQVAARFIAGGGQSIAYFVNYAAALGYTITITQFSPSRFGKPFGLPFGGAAWAFAWQVNAPMFTVERFAFGHDAFGEPFTSSGNTVLQCELQRLAPAHTTVTFSYS